MSEGRDGNVLLGGIFSRWNFLSDHPPALYQSWNWKSSSCPAGEGRLGTILGPAGVPDAQARSEPPPKPAATSQDLPEPKSGELACKLFFGSSFQTGWDKDKRGWNMEGLLPSLQVEGIVEKIQEEEVRWWWHVSSRNLRTLAPYLCSILETNVGAPFPSNSFRLEAPELYYSREGTCHVRSRSYFDCWHFTWSPKPIYPCSTPGVN